MSEQQIEDAAREFNEGYVKLAKSTPPATPQPETPMKLEGYDGYQFCPLCGVVLPCRAHGRVPVTTTDFAQLSADCALSPPTDVERLKVAEELRWTVEGLDEPGDAVTISVSTLRRWHRALSSTPGEPT